MISKSIGNLDQVIQLASAKLFAESRNDQSWDYCAHLGPHFISQYYLVLQWLGLPSTHIPTKDLVEKLKRSQRADGSWDQVIDLNAQEGDLNATIFNYWALKAMGHLTEGECLKNARAFILRRGGIETAALFTRTFLALFGNYPWQKLSKIPYVLFVDGIPSNYTSFSQWVIPHLVPIAYLRHMRAVKKLGTQFDLPELYCGSMNFQLESEKTPKWFYDQPLIEKILSTQQPKGSWGGYTVSTLLSMMALTHFKRQVTSFEERCNRAIACGLDFVNSLYLTPGPGYLEGALMDGHYWDTLLIANALAESGAQFEALHGVADYIAPTQQPSGGFPYGFDFEYAPDVDDTAEAILFLCHLPKYKNELSRAGLWLISMQNPDGGWGAFDRNNVGNPLLMWVTRKYQDSVDLFDDSSADSTGHVLDALGSLGYSVKNSETVCKGVEYLKGTQEENGAWIGRWGINYLFGTTCAVVGLLRAGVDPDCEFIRRAYDWLESRQNTDGGFGESTSSYLDPKFAGVGASTPSQTAWVLFTLAIHSSHVNGVVAERAAKFLMTTFDVMTHGWKDASVTGTGHPGLLYMNYPSYARAFPLMALGRYRSSLKSAALRI